MQKKSAFKIFETTGRKYKNLCKERGEDSVGSE